MLSRSDARPPALRLRALRGQLVLLWTPPRLTSRGVRLLTFVIGRRAPYLRCLTVRHGSRERPRPTRPTSPAGGSIPARFPTRHAA